MLEIKNAEVQVSVQMGKSEVTKKAALKTNSSSDKTTLPLPSAALHPGIIPAGGGW